MHQQLAMDSERDSDPPRCILEHRSWPISNMLHSSLDVMGCHQPSLTLQDARTIRLQVQNKVLHQIESSRICSHTPPSQPNDFYDSIKLRSSLILSQNLTCAMAAIPISILSDL